MAGKVKMGTLLGKRVFDHMNYMMDDSACRMHNVILGNYFGVKAGLILDLTEQRVYYKDKYLMMSALDQPCKHVSDVLDDNRITTDTASEPNRE